MSASQDKKSRQDGGSAKGARLQARQKELQEKKKLRNKVIAVVAVLAILVAFVLVFNSDLLYSGVTAITINGRDYTVTDFNYYYISAISSYQQEMENMYGTNYAICRIFKSNPVLRSDNRTKQHHKIIIPGAHDDLFRQTLHPARLMKIAADGISKSRIPLGTPEAEEFGSVLPQTLSGEFPPCIIRKAVQIDAVRREIIEIFPAFPACGRSLRRRLPFDPVESFDL